MQRTRVQAQEESLEREKQTKYKGSARIRLDHFDFSKSEPDVPDRSNVKNLVSIFEGEGCFQQDSRHHVTAVIDREQLDLATHSTGISSTVLLDNAQTERPELQLPSGFRLECLHGRCRVQAGREMTPPQLWWTVDLYLADLSDDLRTYLTEQLSNEKKPTDGEAYRKIRQHYLNPLAAARWWACLTENKQQELRRLLRREDYAAAFDALLPFPGLWPDGMRFGVTKAMIGSKCDEPQEMFHYLDHVRRFWTDLVRHDKHDMQKVDYVTVKALELKAPGTSTSDSMTLYRQLRKGEIFSTFNLDRRMEIWAKLQAWEGLIPTLWTFFEDFKYIQACAHWVTRLVKVPPRGTLYTAMARSFSEMNQKRGKCIIQEAESVFTFRSSTTQNRVALHYRQVFLYIMRHLRELSPGSTKLEPKPSERKIRTTKDLNRSVLYGLADLAERLGFKSEKISDLKAKNSSHADGRSPSGQSKPVYVVDGPGECQKRRCACPFDLAFEQSKDFLFLDNMHNTDKSQGSSILPVFVRKSVYLAYFGRRVSYSEPELNDQNRENGNQDQERDPSREGIDQIYTPQEQPNAEETREDRDISGWHDYAEQLGDTSRLFESSPRSQSVQGNQEPQPMVDVEELATYDGEREQGSVAPSIISSSFYSDEISPEEGPLEGTVLFEETPLRPIASAPMEATEKDETLQERFKFIFRDGDDWITMEEYFFGPSLSSSVELTAEKHAREGRYLFDSALWSLHPSECFEAAMANGTHVILLFPAGRICISQQLAASASQLGDNARSFKDNTRKRVANDDISTEDQARKKQIL